MRGILQEETRRNGFKVGDGALRQTEAKPRTVSALRSTHRHLWVRLGRLATRPYAAALSLTNIVETSDLSLILPMRLKRLLELSAPAFFTMPGSAFRICFSA
jgi:hypothetical protein